ncbi:MAG: metal-dependent hydrolase [Promethearchaeota archaeon]
MIFFEIPRIKRKNNVNRLALLIGSILPDLIDKPLMLMRLENGRGGAHTLLFAFLSFLVTYIFFKNNKSISYSLLIGILFHLALDLPYVPLFFPFIYEDISFEEYPFEKWYEALFNPLFFTTELLGGSMILFIIFYNKLFSITAIWTYLKQGPQWSS